MHRIVPTILTCVALVVLHPADTRVDVRSEASDVPCPKCQRIFDGRSWDGWEHDAANWTIVDGAMRGFGQGARAAFTKADYTDKDPARLTRGPIGMQKHGSGGAGDKNILLQTGPPHDQ